MSDAGESYYSNAYMEHRPSARTVLDAQERQKHLAIPGLVRPNIEQKLNPSSDKARLKCSSTDEKCRQFAADA